MPNPQRRRLLLLETDAAFGVREAPLSAGQRARPKAPALVAPGARPASPHLVNAAIAELKAGPPRASPSAQTARPPTGLGGPRPAPNPASASNLTPQSATPRAKKPPMPPAPAGDIGDLPPLSPPEKAAALAALQEQAQSELSPYFSEHATRLVFGEGSPDARIMFIGEGPGAEEDKTGRPFIGKSGQLLDKMIAAMGLKREDVYIANVVKLRAADHSAALDRVADRPPTPEEVARGLHILHRQIEIVRPVVIVTLGGPALVHLVGDKEGITKVRGHWRAHRGIPVMPTLHPSYVLRAYTPENRNNVWSDLQQAMKKLA